MTKQAIGAPDKSSHSMNHNSQFLANTETPMFSTNDSCGKLCTIGQNVIVTVCSYSGCNQNDAVVMNKGALQSGLFNSYHEAVIKIELNSHNHSFCDRGTMAMTNNKGSILKVHTGVAQCGKFVNQGNCVMVFKKDNVPQTRTLRQEDCISVIERVDILVNGYIITQKSRRTTNDDYHANGMRIPNEILNEVLFHMSTDMSEHNNNSPGKTECMVIRLRVGSLWVPQIGEKFASRHRQEGTIGLLLEESHMPYMPDRTKPDILFNAHGISRMTIGQQWEKALSMLKLRGDILYDSEAIYSGITGENLGMCCTGVAYYQRLKSMPRDKVHARAMRPVTQLVRQPTDGRSKAGGLRMGEMERGAVIAHGCMSLISERLMWAWDAYMITICSICGPLANVTWVPVGERLETMCKGCKGTGNITNTPIPYSFKLLLQETTACGIKVHTTMSDGVNDKAIRGSDARRGTPTITSNSG